MILDISDATFKSILKDENLYLPIRWDGNDFSSTLNSLFNHYINQLEMVSSEKGVFGKTVCVNVENIKKVCGLIIKTVNDYLNGFPSKSYISFKQIMSILMQQPLRIYQKSAMEQFLENDELKLFRVAYVSDNKPYGRSRVFHTPYTMRSRVSTSRYSIAGYPSLYLGTCLDLCCEEIHVNPQYDFVLASVFKLERTIEYSNTNISVIELGVKPQDFSELVNNETTKRLIDYRLLKDKEVRSAYLLWYPLIAASSYIRTNKNDPFAAEYIIPQLLMQWVRSEISSQKYENYDQLIGIRYFSCASVKASEMGFNYVFPTSGQQKSAKLPYCSILTRAFKLTKPVYIHEYEDIYDCQNYLKASRDYDFVD